MITFFFTKGMGKTIYLLLQSPTSLLLLLPLVWYLTKLGTLSLSLSPFHLLGYVLHLATSRLIKDNKKITRR